jgi:uncharacterized SAM-binding protein YcdF (DUF218 family)
MFVKPKPSPRKSPKPRRFLLFITLVFGFLAAMWRERPAELLVLRDPAVRTDAAMVFGGDPGYERTDHAAKLFRAGLVNMLIVCGGELGPGDSAQSLFERAEQLGVPSDKIVTEEKSTSTRESAVYTRPILEEHSVKSLTLVTSPYHQRRAFLSVRHSLCYEVKLVNSPAEPSFWSPRGWWKKWSSIRIVLMEYGKLAYYFVRGWI